MHSNLLLLQSINHSQHWLLYWQGENTRLPAAPAPRFLAAIPSARRQAWTLPARVPMEFAKIQLRVSGNSEASREVFNTFLIIFRGAQMNCRLKPCKEGQLGAIKTRRDWFQISLLWVTYRRCWEKGAGLLLFLFSQGVGCSSAVQHCPATTMVNPCPQRYRDHISQWSFIPRRHLKYGTGLIVTLSTQRNWVVLVGKVTWYLT